MAVLALQIDLCHIMEVLQHDGPCTLPFVSSQDRAYLGRVDALPGNKTCQCADQSGPVDLLVLVPGQHGYESPQLLNFPLQLQV